MRLLLALIRASVRAQMQYRLSFALWSVGNLVAVGVDYIGLLALFHRFGSLPGWTLPEVAVLYGLVNMAFALAEMAGRGFDQFDAMVRTGDFDRFLLRPRPTALLLAGQTFELSRVGRFSAGLIALLWGTTHAAVVWTPLAVVAVIGGVIAGAFLFYGVLVLQATLCFWTVESLEIVNAITYGGITAAEFPLTLYPTWIRVLFTWIVPLACVNYLPAEVLFQHPGAAPWQALIGPLVGVVFLVVSLQIWRLGERHYRSTGS